MLALSKREGLYEGMKEAVDKLEKMIKLSKTEVLQKNKNEIKPLLEEEICARFYFQKGRIASIIRNDEVLKRAAAAKLVN